MGRISWRYFPGRSQAPDCMTKPDRVKQNAQQDTNTEPAMPTVAPLVIYQYLLTSPRPVPSRQVSAARISMPEQSGDITRVY
jgi:hypothetical protein